MNKMLTVSSPPVYKPRRAHKKSRNGCLRCKQRKTKCDEVTPCCSQCAKRGLCCQYWQTVSEFQSIMDRRLVPNLHLHESHRDFQSSVVPIHSHVISGTESLLSTPSSRSLQILRTVDKLNSSAHPDSDEALDWTELELLSHYLTHTSRTIPFDIDDLYALQVGIPNLAFRSKPLMSSIIALAAVCKSRDLVEQPQQDGEKILGLLHLAERHHRASLLQVQLDIRNASDYDYVLANTTLMVLYASASHCLRIRLAETQKKTGKLPAEFIPAQSQWISLIRAAHLAFVGLLNDHSEVDHIGQSNIEPPLTITLSLDHSQALHIDEMISPENGPTERTKQLLFPILAASSEAALKALRTKAREIWKTEEHTATQSGDSAVKDVDLSACFESLEVLSAIMTEVFSAKDDSPLMTSGSNKFHSGLDPHSLGRLSTVPNWLRSYVARVTSSTTVPRPLRRVIMAFLNRVPARYLSLVQSILDSIGVQADNSQGNSWESSYFELLHSSVAHKLAINIFAHWIVLVMLLDGVWWIGGIGAWELERVISFVRAQGWLDSLCTEKNWWPESMYIVGRELKNLKNAS